MNQLMVPIALARGAFLLDMQLEYIWAQILNFHNISDSACDEISTKCYPSCLRVTLNSEKGSEFTFEKWFKLSQ